MAFSPIRTSTDASTFAGSAVAYRSDSSYFGANQGLRLHDVQFGIVSEERMTWHEKEECYLLSKVIKMDEDIPVMRPLIDSRLKESDLSMRFAGHDELHFIQRNVKADIAYFEFMTDKEKVLEIISRQLGIVPAGRM